MLYGTKLQGQDKTNKKKNLKIPSSTAGFSPVDKPINVLLLCCNCHSIPSLHSRLELLLFFCSLVVVVAASVPSNLPFLLFLAVVPLESIHHRAILQVGKRCYTERFACFPENCRSFFWAEKRVNSFRALPCIASCRRQQTKQGTGLCPPSHPQSALLPCIE